MASKSISMSLFQPASQLVPNSSPRHTSHQNHQTARPTRVPRHKMGSKAPLGRPRQVEGHNSNRISRSLDILVSRCLGKTSTFLLRYLHELASESAIARALPPRIEKVGHLPIRLGHVQTTGS